MGTSTTLFVVAAILFIGAGIIATAWPETVLQSMGVSSGEEGEWVRTGPGLSSGYREEAGHDWSRFTHWVGIGLLLAGSVFFPEICIRWHKATAPLQEGLNKDEDEDIIDDQPPRPTE